MRPIITVQYTAHHGHNVAHQTASLSSRITKSYKESRTQRRNSIILLPRTTTTTPPLSRIHDITFLPQVQLHEKMKFTTSTSFLLLSLSSLSLATPAPNAAPAALEPIKASTHAQLDAALAARAAVPEVEARTAGVVLEGRAKKPKTGSGGSGNSTEGAAGVMGRPSILAMEVGALGLGVWLWG
ncbi:hypothetical protein BS50DRAFT_639284 [Corynespora cassiicola Philippines]|uniref:Uncharacterized protein n=1 Tax=Corynespora cassiicola Philippines TaxID=1448308 RepID=A0A2T2N8B0_CORCC|nr:hypothetical protein BS50DRAFT_639284 [Corynespora cassiicola Philippines]